MRIAFCVPLFAALFWSPPAAAQNQPRSIVVFVADDHGQDTGAYGNRVIQTPNLDAFAQDGRLFTHAFATTASCSASRSVILTGLHNHPNGHYGHQHDFHHFQSFDRIRSLPVLLSAAGYRTVCAGKYHGALWQHAYRQGLETPFGIRSVRDDIHARSLSSTTSGAIRGSHRTWRTNPASQTYSRNIRRSCGNSRCKRRTPGS